MKRGALSLLAVCCCFEPPVEAVPGRPPAPEALAEQPPAVHREAPPVAACVEAPVAPQPHGRVTMPPEAFDAEATAIRPLAAAAGYTAWYEDRTIWLRLPAGDVRQVGHAMGVVSQLRLARAADGRLALAFGDTQGHTPCSSMPTGRSSAGTT